MAFRGQCTAPTLISHYLYLVRHKQIRLDRRHTPSGLLTEEGKTPLRNNCLVDVALKKRSWASSKKDFLELIKHWPTEEVATAFFVAKTIHGRIETGSSMKVALVVEVVEVGRVKYQDGFFTSQECSDWPIDQHRQYPLTPSQLRVRTGVLITVEGQRSKIKMRTVGKDDNRHCTVYTSPGLFEAKSFDSIRGHERLPGDNVLTSSRKEEAL
ncbi:hypothetical protein BT96DRAFT_945764 [Gymnopus androsaceus JB14]|uniref:Uncharacterized protein n=1 Tax=Gymnopus androsaceus JB14 TaxID=1447944 RepID=A0A6A4GYG8_9AGAR|nr:hypothetical protein BT96DRAFT_945764 [Gymnopus androsaceus JB14]